MRARMKYRKRENKVNERIDKWKERTLGDERWERDECEGRKEKGEGEAEDR